MGQNRPPPNSKQQRLADYYYAKYDRWFHYVRQPRRRAGDGQQVLNIPSDLDAEVAVQNVAGKLMIYAARLDETNPDGWIYRTLDCEVADYWRRQHRQRTIDTQDLDLPAAPPAPQRLDQDRLNTRLSTALQQAKTRMTTAERCAFGAYWSALGERERAKRIVRAAQPESQNYDMALNRAKQKIKQALLDEFAADCPAARPGSAPLDEWIRVLSELRDEFLIQVGFECFYELVYDLFCKGLPQVP